MLSGVSLLNIGDFFACLICPIDSVDAAGNECQQENHTAGGVAHAAACNVEIVNEADHPVNAVDAAGDDGQNNAHSNVTLFDRGAIVAAAVRLIGRLLITVLLIVVLVIALLAVLLIVLIVILVIVLLIVLLLIGLRRGERSSAVVAEPVAVGTILSAIRTNHDYSLTFYTVWSTKSPF